MLLIHTCNIANNAHLLGFKRSNEPKKSYIMSEIVYEKPTERINREYLIRKKLASQSALKEH